MRRIFWLAVGLGAGIAGAVMTMRFLRKQASKVAPANLAKQARGGVMDVARLFSESIAEGREAMREKEEELRSETRSGA
ncbi:MAG TPA: hypothetical protein VFK59_05830 [Actinomycetota bacterium]|nr:hypothetical protein [Actinomycetota bacterium]